MGEPAIDMKNRYESKGLSLSDEIHEPPDHISIEQEYLYFLLDKGWSDDDRAVWLYVKALKKRNVPPNKPISR
jgi:TorA maturation chaperone TorD